MPVRGVLKKNDSSSLALAGNGFRPDRALLPPVRSLASTKSGSTEIFSSRSKSSRFVIVVVLNHAEVASS